MTCFLFVCFCHSLCPASGSYHLQSTYVRPAAAEAQSCFWKGSSQVRSCSLGSREELQAHVWHFLCRCSLERWVQVWGGGAVLCTNHTDSPTAGADKYTAARNCIGSKLEAAESTQEMPCMLSSWSTEFLCVFVSSFSAMFWVFRLSFCLKLKRQLNRLVLNSETPPLCLENFQQTALSACPNMFYSLFTQLPWW